MGDSTESWARFLRPDVVRGTFSALGMYLMAHEMLMDSIKRRPREFFSHSWNAEKGWMPSRDYDLKVLALDPKGKKDALRGSLEWFKQLGAIDEADFETLRIVTDTRNRIAHELSQIIGGSVEIDFEQSFPKLFDLLLKIDRWWVINVEIATDPDMMGKEFDEDEVTPGSVMILQILQRVALGEDDEAWELYRKFVENADGK